MPKTITEAATSHPLNSIPIENPSRDEATKLKSSREVVAETRPPIRFNPPIVQNNSFDGMACCKRLKAFKPTPKWLKEAESLESECNLLKSKTAPLNKTNHTSAIRAAEKKAIKDGTEESLEAWKALKARDYNEIVAERRILESIALRLEVERVIPFVLPAYDQALNFCLAWATKQEADERSTADAVGVPFSPSNPLAAVSRRIQWLRKTISSLQGATCQQGRGCHGPRKHLRELVDFATE